VRATEGLRDAVDHKHVQGSTPCGRRRPAPSAALSVDHAGASYWSAASATAPRAHRHERSSPAATVRRPALLDPSAICFVAPPDRVFRPGTGRLASRVARDAGDVRPPGAGRGSSGPGAAEPAQLRTASRSVGPSGPRRCSTLAPSSCAASAAGA
jgi:hypothetical protein